jgi:hypothetical protein
MTTPTVQSLRGTGYNQITQPRLSPDQMQLFQRLYQGTSNGIGPGLDQISRLAGGDPSQFQQLEAPAFRQFNDLQANIASRYSGAGSGSRNSSSFQNAMGGASADFAERLQSQRLGLQNNAIQQLLGLSQSLLGTDLYDTHFMPKKKPFWEELLGSAVPGLSQGASSTGSLFALAKLGLLGSSSRTESRG